jgi:hypothetical protein
MGWANLGSRQVIAGWERVSRALVTEVSILPVSVAAFDAGARVASLSPAVVSSDPVAGGSLS